MENNIYIETAEYLKQRIAQAGKQTPRVAVVLGSGLGKLADRIEEPLTIPYREIPHFKTSTAVGHKGNLIIGMLGGSGVIAMQGRFHYYEGYTMQEVTYPVRVFSLLGVDTLLVSNADSFGIESFKTLKIKVNDVAANDTSADAKVTFTYTGDSGEEKTADGTITLKSTDEGWKISGVRFN